MGSTSDEMTQMIGEVVDWDAAVVKAERDVIDAARGYARNRSHDAFDLLREHLQRLESLTTPDPWLLLKDAWEIIGNLPRRHIIKASTVAAAEPGHPGALTENGADRLCERIEGALMWRQQQSE